MRHQTIRLSPSPLILREAGKNTIYFEHDGSISAFDQATLRCRWSARCGQAYESWAQSGDARFLVGDDLVIAEDGELVRRQAESGAVVARARLDGQLVSAKASGDCAVLALRQREGSQIAVIKLENGFGERLWQLSESEAKEAPTASPARLPLLREYDRRGDYSPGESLRHAELGEGLVQRVRDRHMIVAFSIGGRSLRCGGRAIESARAPRVAARAGRARRYRAAIPCGPWALVGYLDGRNGDKKVKGVEGLELRDLRTGAEHLAAAPAEVECAGTHKNDREIRGVDHDLWAVDDQGAVLSSRGIVSMYEMEAQSGQLRWMAPTEDAYPRLLALTPSRLVALLDVFWARDSIVLEAIDRATGHRAWRTPLDVPAGYRGDIALQLVDEFVCVAWADTELHVRFFSLKDGSCVAVLDRTGLTMPEEDPPPAVHLIPGVNQVIALVQSRGVLVTRLAMP